MKKIQVPFLFTIIAIGIASSASAQVPLDAVNTPVLIDFSTTVPGVNNGPFAAPVPIGDVNPVVGQIDQDAWDYFFDGSPTNAVSSAANFPGSLPNGSGLVSGGSFVAGVNAVDINGHRALGIQPTSSQWTSGNLSLRVANNTGVDVNQLHVSYKAYYFNDQQRSNDLRFYYSTTDAPGSFSEVPSAALVSPADSTPGADWVEHIESFTITGISLAAGYEVYVRWVGNDVGGSGSRDEFAITDLSFTAEIATGPTLIANTAALPAFSQTVGAPSANEVFDLSGAQLTSDVSVSVTAPFEISLDGSVFSTNLTVPQTGGTVSPTAIYARLNSSSSGTFNGDITLSSTGANVLSVALTGVAVSGTNPPLFINELMASNNSTITDEFGEYDDWFELFNPGNAAVNIAGWYATDNVALLTKYQFSPDSMNAIVPAHGWLLVWADNQAAQGNLHTDFSLSAGGEFLAITGPDGVSIVDSISFGPQAADTSYGLAHDGLQPWVFFSGPTPGASNNPVSVEEYAAAHALLAWPNPAVGCIVYLQRAVSGVILDAQGRTVLQLSSAVHIDMSALLPGVYVLRTAQGATVRLVRP